MANNYAAILADIKAKMEAVADIGVVHDYYRGGVEPSRFMALFSYAPSGANVKQIRGWEITRASAQEHKRGAFFRHHQFRLTGYMGLKDADGTDKTFQTL